MSLEDHCLLHHHVRSKKSCPTMVTSTDPLLISMKPNVDMISEPLTNDKSPLNIAKSEAVARLLSGLSLSYTEQCPRKYY